jgi:hypothetical protein
VGGITAALVVGSARWAALVVGSARWEVGGGRERRITAALVVGSARWEVGERWTAGLLGGRE